MKRQMECVIVSTERVGTSTNGNPTYRVHFASGGSALTKTDASVGYGISNSDLRNVPVIVTTERGRVVRVERVDGRADA